MMDDECAGGNGIGWSTHSGIRFASTLYSYVQRCTSKVSCDPNAASFAGIRSGTVLALTVLRAIIPASLDFVLLAEHACPLL
jgi:hypothetical protein